MNHKKTRRGVNRRASCDHPMAPKSSARSLLRTPEVIIQTWRAASKTDKGLAESEVRGALFEFEPLWNELFPAEQARIVELLVERVDLQPDGIDLRLRIEGLTSLCSELRTSGGSQQEAA